MYYLKINKNKISWGQRSSSPFLGLSAASKGSRVGDTGLGRRSYLIIQKPPHISSSCCVLFHVTTHFPMFGPFLNKSCQCFQAPVFGRKYLL